MLAGGTLPTPLYVLYRRALHFSEITLTLLFAAYVLGAFAALILLGRLSDELGRKRATMPAIATAAVSTLLFLFADSLAMLFIARVLSGFSVGLASGAGTAWIAELQGGRDRRRASLLAVGANFAGLGCGPLLAGGLAQYAPWPLRLVYGIFLAMLLPAALAARGPKETVESPVARLRDLSLRPRIGLPREIRAMFISPAATGFATFSLLGFYTALTPSLLERRLHQPNHTIGGAVVSELFAIGLATLLLTRGTSSRAAMFAGLLLLPPSLALVIGAEQAQSLALLLAGTALAGASAALGYRGSLEVVNEIAPERRRAEVVSSYFVACYCGVSVPVVGIGVLSHPLGQGDADIVFASIVALCAAAALVMGWKYAPRRER